MTNGELARELYLQLLRTNMTFRQTIQRILRRHNFDMTFEMLQILYRLWAEQGVSQQYLAEKTAKDKACLTHLVNNLEKRGWVIRRKDMKDQRSKLIFLTPEGEHMVSRLRPLINEVYGHAGEKMGPEMMLSCLDGLKKLDEGFDEV